MADEAIDAAPSKARVKSVVDIAPGIAASKINVTYQNSACVWRHEVVARLPYKMSVRHSFRAIRGRQSSCEWMGE